ncbi:hypothetical protein [Actinocorallia longicatena]|uniref:Uncharacterized protein n=1 Tax=Actinocorallia longicatena TaxID=111803 RepID=A0ABP6QCF3_9ACTN
MKLSPPTGAAVATVTYKPSPGESREVTLEWSPLWSTRFSRCVYFDPENPGNVMPCALGHDGTAVSPRRRHTYWTLGGACTAVALASFLHLRRRRPTIRSGSRASS